MSFNSIFKTAKRTKTTFFSDYKPSRRQSGLKRLHCTHFRPRTDHHNTRRTERLLNWQFAVLTRMLPSVEDRGQTDRIATPTRPGLRRCHWPRSILATPSQASLR